MGSCPTWPPRQASVPWCSSGNVGGPTTCFRPTVPGPTRSWRCAGSTGSACAGFTCRPRGGRSAFRDARWGGGGLVGSSHAPAQDPACRERDAHPLVQRSSRPADPAPTGAASRHRTAGRAGRPGAAVPHGADRAGGHERAVRRDPRRGPRRLPALAPEPALPGVPAGEGARYPARIYYKYEGVSPAGSHKPNTSVPQAFYNAQAGIRRLTTETGAGQWGTALAFACAQFGLECEVWQVRASYDQKPYRKMMIETFGGTVHPSPSELTVAGRKILADHPDSTGSLGIAISEAVEVAAQDPTTNYSLGSVLNHVLMHQTIIGEEALLQLAQAGETPDLLIGCTGGGSNFGGLMFPFLRERWAGRMSPIVRAVEPAACPSLTQGTYAYDFGDTAGMTPLMKMHTLGHDFVPDPIHAGGLRYHGMSPLISHLYDTGELEAVAKTQSECFAAGVLFARTE